MGRPRTEKPSRDLLTANFTGPFAAYRQLEVEREAAMKAIADQFAAKLEEARAVMSVPARELALAYGNKNHQLQIGTDVGIVELRKSGGTDEAPLYAANWHAIKMPTPAVVAAPPAVSQDSESSEPELELEEAEEEEAV